MTYKSIWKFDTVVSDMYKRLNIRLKNKLYIQIN